MESHRGGMGHAAVWDSSGEAILPGMLFLWEREGAVCFCGTVGNPTVAGRVGRDGSGREQAHTPVTLIS